ncbi:MAG: Nit6803 family nitriliase [Moraxellaceae bacterium]|nr:Nit6803 family nitriliase [Moraxellaceae bacterium]
MSAPTTPFIKPAARVVRAAAVQIAPVLDSATGTLDKVCDAIDRAAAQGAQLVVFPETFVPYYPYFSFVKPAVAMGADHMRLYELAVTVPGPVTLAVAERARARGVVVVLGVNERDHGSLYNTQLVFDANGALVLKRRKITPTYHERMVWGQGDASGLKAVDTAVGKLGALACWEHYNPLARYALMTQHEEIHCSQFPGSMVGQVFADQIEVTIRHHALESGCFVVNATGWLTDEQIAAITPDTGLQRALRGGCNTAIVSPEGNHLAPPLREGEGMVIADLDMSLITKRKRMMDSVGHYARPELLSLLINDRPATPVASMNSSNAMEATTQESRHDTDAYPGHHGSQLPERSAEQSPASAATHDGAAVVRAAAA